MQIDFLEKNELAFHLLSAQLLTLANCLSLFFIQEADTLMAEGCHLKQGQHWNNLCLQCTL